MHARYLILTLALTLGAGVAAAALKYGHIEPPKAMPAAEHIASAIPRVVVTASSAQAAQAPVARVVVVGRRSDAGQVVAARN